MNNLPFRLLAWLCFAGIVFVTVSPIGLRPHDLLPVDLDRAGAFALMSLLFILAYPRHWIFCAVLTLLGAGGIELLQYLSPSRHAHVDDALVKAAGAMIGCLLGWTLNRFRAQAPA
jgi:hypothetical protein